MKQFLLLSTLFFVFVSCKNNEAGDESEDVVTTTPNLVTFDGYNQRISYAIGFDHGFTSQQVYSGENTKDKFTTTDIEAGMVDYLSDNDLRVSIFSIDSILNLYLGENGSVNEQFVSKGDASYAIGLVEAQDLVGSLVGRGIDQTIDVSFLVKGIEHGMHNNQQSMSLSTARSEVAQYYSDINKSLGEKFLEQNAQNQNVTTTESGLQYEIIKEGDGISPNLTDSVLVHYTGRFIDGRVFESTIPSKIPAAFTPLGVIKGWQEGLLLMKEGGSARFYIPYDLAYGEQGSGPIEPYSTLVFDIDLIRVTRFKL